MTGVPLIWRLAKSRPFELLSVIIPHNTLAIVMKVGNGRVFLPYLKTLLPCVAVYVVHTWWPVYWRFMPPCLRGWRGSIRRPTVSNTMYRPEWFTGGSPGSNHLAEIHPCRDCWLHCPSCRFATMNLVRCRLSTYKRTIAR